MPDGRSFFLTALFTVVGATIVSRLWRLARGELKLPPEPEHPLWQTASAYVVTLLLLLSPYFALSVFAPTHASKGLTFAVAGACFLVNPRVWWIWELAALEDFRFLLGDRLTMGIYWSLGTAILLFGLG